MDQRRNGLLNRAMMHLHDAVIGGTTTVGAVGYEVLIELSFCICATYLCSSDLRNGIEGLHAGFVWVV